MHTVRNSNKRIGTIKSLLCCLALSLSGCASMTDSDWEALGSFAEALAGATPSKSTSSSSSNASRTRARSSPSINSTNSNNSYAPPRSQVTRTQSTSPASSSYKDASKCFSLNRFYLTNSSGNFCVLKGSYSNSCPGTVHVDYRDASNNQMINWHQYHYCPEMVFAISRNPLISLNNLVF